MSLEHHINPTYQSNKDEASSSVFSDNTYVSMLKEIGEQKFTERFKELLETMDTFLKESGYSDYVACNERILLAVLLDYWSDIYRLKDFHLIEKSRTDKIFSYLIYWLLHRKPLQFTKYTDKEKDIYVNERFCAYLLLNECLMSGQRRIPIKYKNKLDEYIDYVFYCFKYRKCTAQDIEFAIRSFEMGVLTLDMEQASDVPSQTI